MRPSRARTLPRVVPPQAGDRRIFSDEHTCHRGGDPVLAAEVARRKRNFLYGWAAKASGSIPLPRTGQIVTVNESRDNEINSVVEMLKSRALVEMVVDDLGPALVLNAKYGKPQQANAANTWMNASIERIKGLAASIDPIDDRERAVQTMLKALAVDVRNKSYVVTLRYCDVHPEKAQRITSRLVDVYLDEHLRANRTPGSQDFFDGQSRLMRAEWELAAEQLKRAKNQLGLVSIEMQRGLIAQEGAQIGRRVGDGGNGLGRRRRRNCGSCPVQSVNFRCGW